VPLTLETVTFPEFGEDKAFNADISDFPTPKEWKYVTNWKEFDFSPRVRKIGEALFQLNQVEMFELMKLLQLRFDVPDSALMGGGVVVQAAGAGAAPAAAAAAAPAEEPKEEKKEKMIFDVQLTAVAEADKFKVLKEIRALKPGMKLLEVRCFLPFVISSAAAIDTCVCAALGSHTCS
jgi:ribosomal protein L7/L12